MCRIFVAGALLAALLPGRMARAEEATAPADANAEEVQRLREELAAQKAEHERQMRRLQEQIDRLAEQHQPAEPPPAPEPAAAGQEAEPLAAALDRARQEQAAPEVERSLARPAADPARRAWQSMNPDISVIIDLVYALDSHKAGGLELREDVLGFSRGHSHGHGHGHDHAHGIEPGFNLREIEVHLSADVDPYFTAFTTLAFDLDEVEVEEAVIRDTFLPWGLQLQAGKFFSDIGRINRQHPHDWDFVDRPLVNELMFGDHGLNELGVQLSWLAPTDTHWLTGVEVLQGDNEGTFRYEGGDVRRRTAPRAVTAWTKLSPELPRNHATQLGLFGGYGRHQEEHGSRHLDGFSYFTGVDAVYKYRPPGQRYGHGSVTVQAEYMHRWKSLDNIWHQNPDFIGRSQKDRQDGYYVQATYGFAPRWRAGARWDHVGLTNRSRRPDGTRNWDDTYRGTLMVDFTPSEFSRFRLQGSRGVYETDHGRESNWEAMLQWIISIGPHGAHEF